MDLIKLVLLYIRLVTCLAIIRCISAQGLDARAGPDVAVTRQRTRTLIQDRPTVRQQTSVSGQRRISSPNRSRINTRNLQISRARGFPNRGSSITSGNTVQIDPRIIDQRRVAFIRMRNRRPTSQNVRTSPNARTMQSARPTQSTRTSADLSTNTCPSPRSIRCYIWSNDRDLSNAFRCEGSCRGRRCVLPCECSCVHPRLIGALLSIGRIRGPELRPLDNRLRSGRQQDTNTNTPLAIRRALQRRLGSSQRRGQNATNDVTSRRPVVPTINFGISDDVLATLIAQPVLNEIVGPQGINQIIAGEPPPLLSREAMSRGASTRRQQNGRPGSSTSGQSATSGRLAERNLGIPVPISQLNLFPQANLRSSSEMLPAPTDMPRVSTPVSDVNVQQLPGTNVLFVNLSRSGGPSANRRSVAERLNIATPMDVPRSRDVINTTSLSRDVGLVPSMGLNINNLIQESAIPSRFLPPTKAECLSMGLELWCDPQPSWDGTPGVSRWCLLNCRADNCDNQRCACSCIEEILFTTKYDQLTLPAP